MTERDSEKERGTASSGPVATEHEQGLAQAALAGQYK